MTWTQGQQRRTNPPPFIEPEGEDMQGQPGQSGSPARNYKPYTRRNDHAPRQSAAPAHPKASEVAASFTQDGLRTFSTIFSSTVEAAIAKSLPDIVEKAVEKQLQVAIKAATLEMDQWTDRLAASIATQVEESVLTRLNHQFGDSFFVRHTARKADINLPSHPDTDMTDTSTASQIHTSSDTGIGSRTASHAQIEASNDGRMEPPSEVELVVQTLKRAGRPIRAAELRAMTQDVHWGTNPSVKMKALITKSAGQIHHPHRGVYEYKSPNVE